MGFLIVLCFWYKNCNKSFCLVFDCKFYIIDKVNFFVYIVRVIVWWYVINFNCRL